MADAGSRSDPFVAFRFEVRIDGLAVGGFSEVGGLQLETEIEDYVEGGLNTHVHKFVTRTKQSNLTFKNGVVDTVLYDWYVDVVKGKPLPHKSGSIVVSDPSGGETVMEWQFRRAIPVKWSGPELNASQNNIAVESFELAHHGLERTK